MPPTVLFWLALIAYSLIMLYVGYLRRVSRRERLFPALEFWMAKRQLPGWMLAASLTSGWLMLGWIGFGMAQVYFYGATALWILNIPWFILCLIVIAIVPLVRRIPSVSVPQAIEQRFGRPARTLIALFSVFVFIAWTQAELFMGGKLIAPFLNIPVWLAMAALIAPVLVYMYLGGFRVVVITDTLQFSLMALFMIILAGGAVLAASKASHGHILQALAHSAPPLSGSGNVYNLWFLGFLFPVVLLVGYLPGWLLEQDLILRIQAAPSTKEAYKGAIFGLVLISVFVLALPTVVAACALVAFPPAGSAPHAAIGADALGIVSAFVAQLPLPLVVFMLIGIVACQMSTVDTFTNVASLALAYDILDPVLQRRKVTPGTRLLVSRWITMLTLLVALACAIYSESLNDVYYISSGVLSACVAIPAIFIYWKRATTPAVLAGSILGFIATVGGYFYEVKYAGALPSFLQQAVGYNYVAAGVVVSTLTISIVSLVTRRSTVARLQAVHLAPVDDFSTFSRITGHTPEPAVALTEAGITSVRADHTLAE